MAEKNQGQKLWQRAKTLIPGGNQLLSKRPEMFLPESWPTYFSKSETVFLWDLDNKKYLDMCLMGVGTNTLGYCNPVVDSAVIKTVSNGNMTTLNCPEEVMLAEKLIEQHEWADMVRFARSGGEANAIAIRIGRAASGRHNIAFCGYHGWHDWYLSANIENEDNLTAHLLQGLEANGVPSGLRGTSHPFKYGDLVHLKYLIQEKNIGVIKMEVARNKPADPKFLCSVRDLATKHGIVLIFDECTSGFRETLGGLHKIYKVAPDLAVFGKALGNGYAITAIIGRGDVMESAQSTFISSTFWTERIGFTAAVACISEMEKTESASILPKNGKKMKNGWETLAKLHKLPIVIQGIDAIPNFYIESDCWLEQKTFISQQMLKKGILASNIFYPSVCHQQSNFDQYFEQLDKVFGLIAEYPDATSLTGQLEGPVCHAGFNRLN